MVELQASFSVLEKQLGLPYSGLHRTQGSSDLKPVKNA
jgi:hypothetical protein